MQAKQRESCREGNEMRPEVCHVVFQCACCKEMLQQNGIENTGPCEEVTLRMKPKLEISIKMKDK